MPIEEVLLLINIVNKNKKMKIDWINCWNSYKKNGIFEFTLRLGFLTIIEIYMNFDLKEHRFMIFNLGFEVWK